MVAVPVDDQRLVTAVVLADLAGFALARSDNPRHAGPARQSGGLEALKASGGE
jgi:hypothetical protein